MSDALGHWRWAIGLVVALVPGSPARVHAQAAVRGSVMARETDAPIAGAQVRALVARSAAVTDRFGRFTLWLPRFPDTLVVAFIGRQPDTLALAAEPEREFRIALAQRAVVLADVTVAAPAASSLDLQDVGRWQLPLEALRAVPPAVETDVFRALTAVPAVSFSTPLSARPIVRGYDAGESSLRIDGFEILNLYHIGRIFSAFPADATEQVSVAAAPQGIETGGTLAGVVDVTGKTASPDATHGGANLSLASASTWLGGGTELRTFGAARAVYYKAAEVAAGRSIPYDFQDLYLNTAVMAGDRPRGRVTAFVTRDHLLDRDVHSGMDWSNLLIGTRWRLLERGGFGLDLATAATRFSEDVANVHARRSFIDVRNRFTRLGSDLTLGYEAPQTRLRLGFSGGWRSIANRITMRSGTGFVPTDVTVRRAEYGAFGEVTQAVGPLTVQAGLRVDAAGANAVWQPRARIRAPLGNAVSIALSAGRTGRLFHLVADPTSATDLAFYDFWLSAGENGVPIPRVDHAAADLEFERGRVQGRLSAFASRGRGLVELRPETQPLLPGTDQFRVGHARTAGVESQVGIRSTGIRPSSLSLSYVLSWSERRWDDEGWIPWVQDRRHLVRLLGQTVLGERWNLSAAVEAASGAPITPVATVSRIGVPTGEPGRLTPGLPVYVAAPENSGRGGGTFRMDLGANYRFQGPWRSRMWLGLSLLNAGWGPVAPLEAKEPIEEGRPIQYERTFSLPPVPTATLRMEF